jgi:hypothetical protein
MDALLDALIAVIGLSALAAIGMRYPCSRMFAAPLAIIWMTFWTMHAGQAMGMLDRVHLSIVAVIAAAVATVVAVTIPYTIEEWRPR